MLPDPDFSPPACISNGEQREPELAIFTNWEDLNSTQLSLQSGNHPCLNVSFLYLVLILLKSLWTGGQTANNRIKPVFFFPQDNTCPFKKKMLSFNENILCALQLSSLSLPGISQKMFVLDFLLFLCCLRDTCTVSPHLHPISCVKVQLLRTCNFGLVSWLVLCLLC